MLAILFLLFTVVPLIELTLLIWIGGQTAWWVPISMVLLTGIAGDSLARWQGSRALQRIQDDLRAGRMPADAVIDGVLILVAGILLVTPGVLTDVAGVALLFPPSRALVKRAAIAWFSRRMQVRTARFAAGVQFEATSRPAGATTAKNTGDEIIDAKVISTRVEAAD